jgi:hypothetical protein
MDNGQTKIIVAKLASLYGGTPIITQRVAMLNAALLVMISCEACFSVHKATITKHSILFLVPTLSKKPVSALIHKFQELFIMEKRNPPMSFWEEILKFS